MNVPAPKFLIEKTWEGRVFGTEWRSAAGGSLDVFEPATGAKITSVGNATAADVRRTASDRGPHSPAGRRRRTRSGLRSCARPPASWKTIRKN
ncbi:MAG: hypothetical protein WA858_18660 [Xanthobacteraceae bacterium]